MTTPDTLVQLDCDHDHAPTFVRDDDDFSSYIPCPWCVADDAWERVREFEHARNLRRHRRHPGASTRLAQWLASWAYALGVIAGYGTTYSNTCRGCVDAIKWRGRRPYVLGVARWQWSCLLRGRHWPGEYIGLDACGKCLPCPDCGTTAADHDCPNGADQ